MVLTSSSFSILLTYLRRLPYDIYSAYLFFSRGLPPHITWQIYRGIKVVVGMVVVMQWVAPALLRMVFPPGAEELYREGVEILKKHSERHSSSTTKHSSTSKSTKDKPFQFHIASRRAQRKFRLALSKNPNLGMAYVALAREEMRRGHYEDCVKTAQLGLAVLVGRGKKEEGGGGVGKDENRQKDEMKDKGMKVKEKQKEKGKEEGTAAQSEDAPKLEEEEKDQNKEISQEISQDEKPSKGESSSHSSKDKTPVEKQDQDDISEKIGDKQLDQTEEKQQQPEKQKQQQQQQQDTSKTSTKTRQPLIKPTKAPKPPSKSLPPTTKMSPIEKQLRNLVMEAEALQKYGTEGPLARQIEIGNFVGLDGCRVGVSGSNGRRNYGGR